MQANEPRKQKTVTKAQLLSACDRRTRSSHSDQPQAYQLAPVIALGSLQIGSLFISASMVLPRGVTACRNMANMRCCLWRSWGVVLGQLRIWELWTQKLKPHLLRTQSLKVLLKPGVGQQIATRATLTARDFFLANSYPSGPFTCIFQASPEFFLC